MLQYKAKPLFYFSLACCGLVLVILFFSCQKKAEPATVQEQPLTASHPVFHKGVGAPIDSATANRWKRNLAQKLSKHRSSATTTTTTYYFPAAVLRDLITRANSVGILFYFGKDSTGNVSMEPIGVDDKNYVMPTTTVVTSGGTVSWKVARQWRDQFQQQYPTDTWGYFYGSVAIQRLLDQGTEVVRISLGINDTGTLQLIYSNAAIEDPVYEEDHGMPCPPCATELEASK